MAILLGALAGPGRQLTGAHDIDLVGATHDSRQVKPGYLFCCVPGDAFDGHDFAATAVDQGASALLVERLLDLDVSQLLVDDVRAAMGSVSAAIYDNPSGTLSVVGVTGTNGKTTVTEILVKILSHAGLVTDSIGTLSGARTTPEAPELQGRLAQMRDRGVGAVAMEVSSHALELHRVDGCHFAVAVFTNLGRDHLDFHHTQEAYFAAKAKLFVDDRSDIAVINLDDPKGRELAALTTLEVVGYGLGDAKDLRHEGAFTRFVWRGFEVRLGLAGSHNVSNALAALEVARVLGVDLEAAIAGLASMEPPAGRFEFVPTDAPFSVIVDYAHTPDALAAAIDAAREVATDGRVVLVFGCGGDRDHDKRSEMGRVASEQADAVFVTSDNPRSEDPHTIIDAIVSGFGSDSKPIVNTDRASAIGQAIDSAQSGDVVLIAGKGHETSQTIGSQVLPFDDRVVAREALESRANAKNPGATAS